MPKDGFKYDASGWMRNSAPEDEMPKKKKKGKKKGKFPKFMKGK